jgi:hypothetical protein
MSKMLLESYARAFGAAPEQVLPAVEMEVEGAPSVEVAVFPPTEKRDYYTLATIGMSAALMPTADLEAGDVASKANPAGTVRPRAELLLYVTEPMEHHIEWLRWLASFPWNEPTFIHIGHTIDYPEQPLVEDSELLYFILLEPLQKTDAALRESVNVDGCPVAFFWPVPITAGELEFKRAEGFDAFLDLLEEVEHPVVLDEDRGCYVSEDEDGEEDAPLTREQVFQLVCDEVMRDGMIEANEAEILTRLAQFLRLPPEAAKEMCRTSLARFQAGELGAKRALDPKALYETVLKASADEQDATQEQLLRGLRILLGLETN